MKKLLLILSIFFISLSASAADLNPFAYNLNSEYNEHAQTLTINFTLNAPASYVKLVVLDGATEVWTKEYLASSYLAGKVPKDTYTEVINVLEAGLPQGKSLTWRVDVKGAAVANPTFVKNDVRLFAPTSVDIDNNPENANFGTVFCVESRDGGKGNDTYLSEKDGMGLYIFNADGTPRKIPNQVATERYGYNGAITGLLTTTEFNSNPGDKEAKGSSYFLYRVRVSDDGRVFITSLSPDGHVLFEANKEVFSHPDAPDWISKTTWTKVISKDNSNTTQKTVRNNCSDANHKYCNIYNLYTTDKNEFIAGPNCGFDVQGSGPNLKLLMLSGCKQAISGIAPIHFYCCEYDLGERTMWNVEPSRKLFTGNTENLQILNYGGVQVQYDKQGNVWLCQHRASNDNAPTLLKISPSGTVTNVDGKTIPYRRCGAIRFNEDFSRVVVASNEHGSGGGFTYYDVDDNGNWTKNSTVNTYTKTGYSLMDFAWDYAGNLYMVADLTTNGERIAVYAMPRTADEVVSTPAASKYAFTVNCPEGEYTVTTSCNPLEAGTITCSVAGNTIAADELTLESCTELTVTATPEDGYKFLNWTDGNDNVLSTETEYSLYVTEGITLQANFEYATYTGIVWKSLFMNGQDIADENPNYPNTNERLWRLMQVEYNDKYTDRSNYPDLTSSNVVTACKGKKTQLNVIGFFGRDNANAANAKTFFKNNLLFNWLEDYMVAHSKNNLGTTTRTAPWYGYAYLFFNRTDTAILWYEDRIGDRATYLFNGGDCAQTSYGNENNPWDSFIEYGKPKHWRPYWAEHACNLPMTMKYSDYMPTIATWNWNNLPCPSGSIAGVEPRDWYKWNVPANNPAVQDVPNEKYFILAWRNGSPTAEEIVHHVYESNMELHASYVLKNIDEEDRVDVSKYDASNDDVIQLMLNRHWVDLNPDTKVVPEHDLTVTRKLQAGMFNTICLPFRVGLTTLQDDQNYSHPLRDAEAYRFTGTTTSTYDESGDPVTILNFNKVTVLEPGVPYLIKLKEGNADVVADMPFLDVACYTSLTPSVGGGLIFQPTINPTEVPAGSLILVANDRLALTTSTGEMMGMRGYFMIDPSNPLLADDIAEQAKDGRVYLSFKKPTTTSLPMAPEAEQQTKPQVRKIMYDGKIYILRGDEVYTITGHRVK